MLQDKNYFVWNDNNKYRTSQSTYFVIYYFDNVYTVINWSARNKSNWLYICFIKWKSALTIIVLFLIDYLNEYIF